MLIGIIGAMHEEVEALKQEMIIHKELHKARMHFIKGLLWDREVVVVVSGVGKVNAAICTQILIDDFSVDCIINVGVAGGVSEDVSPGDIVIGTSLIQHDMDTTMFGDKLGQIPRLDTFDFKSELSFVDKLRQVNLGNDIKIIEGVIVTGDQFISNPQKAKFLVDTFDAKATEMEGASIAHTSYLNNKPFIVIRSISDNASTGANIEFDKFVSIAVDHSTKLLKILLESI